MDNNCNIFCNGQKENCNYDISCFQKIAGTLTGKEIKAHGLIIEQGTQHKPTYQTTTVDLCVGDGHYIYDGQSEDTDKKWSLLFIGEDEQLDKLNNKFSNAEKYMRPKTDRGQTLSIPPYGSALIQLNEMIDTHSVACDPNKRLLIVGRFDLKLSAVHAGLISQQATQIEPCYKGKLFCFIHNLSNKNIDLKYGEKIATVEFSYVSCFCNTSTKEKLINELVNKNKDKYRNEYCNGTGIDDIRYFYNTNRLPSDCGLLSFKKDFLNHMRSDEVLSEITEKVEKKVETKVEDKVKEVELKAKNSFEWWKLIITAFVSLLLCLIPLYFQNQNTSEKIETLSEELQKLEERYEKIESSNEKDDIIANSESINSN